MITKAHQFSRSLFHTLPDHFSRLANHLLPSQCLFCRASCDPSCCEGCYSDLPWIVYKCEHCGIPLTLDLTLDLTLEKHANCDTHTICGKCLKHPPSYDRCIPAFVYTSPIDALIHKFKNHRDLTAGYALSQLLWRQISCQLDDDLPDLLCPMPLHWRRQLIRGFNQSAFITSQLHLASKIPVKIVAKRRIATPKQQFLSRSQRLKNLREAFSVDRSKVEGKKIAIIDDVVTTGATVESLSKTLKRHGAKRVDIWCISRTPEQRTASASRLTAT